MELTRKTARVLIDKKVSALSGGLSLNELPDSFALCNALDDMDGMELDDDAHGYASDVALDLLQAEGFPV